MIHSHTRTYLKNAPFNIFHTIALLITAFRNVIGKRKNFLGARSTMGRNERIITGRGERIVHVQ